MLYHTLVAPLPVQCYGLCSISISGVLKVMDNVEGNYREGIHAREGVEHGRKKLGVGCREWLYGVAAYEWALVVKSCENHPSHLVKKEILWLV